MTKVIAWIKNHIVLTWAIIGLVFAIAVHVAFSATAITPWFVAKWTPGDILTYVGTVSLGLLAVWQNNRFKEENDISQNRLEHLTVKANEINAINKIIEVESARLDRIRTAFDCFSTACDPQVLTAVYVEKVSSPNISIEISAAMVSAQKMIDDAFFAISRELRSDNKLQKSDDFPIKTTLRNYYYSAKEFTENTKNSPTANHGSLITILAKARDEFIPEREKYLIEKEKILNTVIYGDLSLQQVKSLYCSDY